jgi:hypothetical protein
MRPVPPPPSPATDRIGPVPAKSPPRERPAFRAGGHLPSILLGILVAEFSGGQSAPKCKGPAPSTSSVCCSGQRERPVIGGDERREVLTFALKSRLRQRVLSGRARLALSPTAVALTETVRPAKALVLPANTLVLGSIASLPNVTSKRSSTPCPRPDRAC